MNQLDPREVVEGCACPRVDRMACMEARGSRADTGELEDCPCACHDLYEEQIREEEEAEERDDFDPLACPGCGGNCQTACR